MLLQSSITSVPFPTGLSYEPPSATPKKTQKTKYCDINISRV